MKHNYILVTSGEPGGIGPDVCLDLANYTFDNHTVIILGDIELLQARANLLYSNDLKPQDHDIAPDIYPIGGGAHHFSVIPTCSSIHKKNISFTSILPSNIDFNTLDSTQINNLFDAKNIATNKKGVLLVLHIPCPNKNTIGVLLPENARYVMQMLDTAVMLCQQKITNIIVTLPISKEIINKANLYSKHFSGHTEYFAEAFGCEKVVMMLATSKMKVALLTTHIPLSHVIKYITAENIIQTVQVIHDVFQIQYKISKPKIAVCGVNPHAGEGGYIGHEEMDIINPAIQLMQKDGIDVSGSYSADTIFNRANEFDVILAMYHDQGLPVLKYSGFKEGINVTLGLPIIRTSVDHGTALSLAGTGCASSESLINAILFAVTN